ncbi:MAG: cytosolic protein [Prevotellaceae bacterium]|jgi:hypothetical protein|nr:cytosolic protein [Prevotellaceae bacterium]
MKTLKIAAVTQYVEENIGTFHQKRYDAINKLQLKTILKRKNPYLFKAKSIQTAGEIVKGLTDAFLSSRDETIFGDWLEGLAIFVNQKVYNGWKSGIQGIDLEFDRDNIRYIVSVKSSPNWGNSSQVKKMKSDFVTAKKTLRTSNSKLKIEAVNGCCCGIDNNSDKGEYFKLCGQEFWTFISGNENLYLEIIEPLGNKAKERNEEFHKLYVKTINKFTLQFVNEFCQENGEIDWYKIVKFNSGKENKTKRYFI